jgi:3alpha(or 20beta)-hydroxysteroid dehydrogenase
VSAVRAGRLEGKVALITGGARGQGAAEARLFADEGACVVVADVRVEMGEELVAELGDCAMFSSLDVSREEEWESALAATVERFGALHVLVNNAGIGHSSPIVEHTLADYERVVAVNQVGVFLGMRAVIPAMTDAGGGSIVNVSSGAGLRATKFMIGYAATKYAVTGMTAAAALELARYGIRVNSIHPGVIDTPMLGDIRDPIGSALVKSTPMRRMGRPEEIAQAVLFLASDESSYVTGAHLPIDGGMTA